MNLTMSNRRFTRLTNAFSTLYAMHYNFCRIHRILRVTPAKEAGVSDHVWSIGEVIALLP